MSTKVKYTFEEHLVTQQNRAEAEFLAAFDEAKPSLEDAHVIVNPYLINPLAAVILFTTEKPVGALNSTGTNFLRIFSKAKKKLGIPVIVLIFSLR